MLLTAKAKDCYDARALEKALLFMLQAFLPHSKRFTSEMSISRGIGVLHRFMELKLWLEAIYFAYGLRMGISEGSRGEEGGGQSRS